MGKRDNETVRKKERKREREKEKERAVKLIIIIAEQNLDRDWKFCKIFFADFVLKKWRNGE